MVDLNDFTSKSRNTLVSNLLRGYRKEAGLRQIDLANKLHKPQSYVSKYEIGEKTLSFLEVFDICAELNISISELSQKFEGMLRSNKTP